MIHSALKKRLYNVKDIIEDIYYDEMDDIEVMKIINIQPQALSLPILHRAQLLFMMTNNDWDDEMDASDDDDGLNDDEDVHSNVEECI